MTALTRAAGLSVVADDAGSPQVLIEKDLNVTAKRLGEIVSRLDLYEMNGEQVFFDHMGRMMPMTGRIFRTWICDHVVMVERYDKQSGNPIAGRLEIADAATILDCMNFRRGVRRLQAINQVRLPVFREGTARMELLPWGYDVEYETYTIPGGLEYEQDMALESVKGWFERMFNGFPFSDERSKAVQVAALLALYIKHLPGGTGLRPGFLWLANKAGSGKSVLAKAALYPVMGTAASAKMKKGEELDKELEAFSRANVPFIFLDNVYGGIQSASIDQLLTSEESMGRAMGGHGVFSAKNSALLLVTGNRLELNDDARRRFLIVDLFEKGETNERVVLREWRLNDKAMRSEEWRCRLLSMCWSLVRHWHEQGLKAGSMLRGKVVLESFEEFSELLGGIVAAAGYEEPFQRAVIPDAISPEKAEFAELLDLVVGEMGEKREMEFTLQDLAKLARSAGLFGDKIGTAEEGRKLTIKEDGIAPGDRANAVDEGYMTAAHRSAWGKRMKDEVGGEPRSKKGVRVEFGRRKESRKAGYTVRRLE